MINVKIKKYKKLSLTSWKTWQSPLSNTLPITSCTKNEKSQQLSKPSSWEIRLISKNWICRKNNNSAQMLFKWRWLERRGCLQKSRKKKSWV